MARVVVSLVLTTPTARALTPPTRVLPGRRAVAVAAAPAALPTLAAACALPTCLGFYKREYGVSYGSTLCRNQPPRHGRNVSFSRCHL